jgi:hypothetical protein
MQATPETRRTTRGVTSSVNEEGLTPAQVKKQEAQRKRDAKKNNGKQAVQNIVVSNNNL